MQHNTWKTDSCGAGLICGRLRRREKLSSAKSKKKNHEKSSQFTDQDIGTDVVMVVTSSASHL